MVTYKHVLYSTQSSDYSTWFRNFNTNTYDSLITKIYLKEKKTRNDVNNVKFTESSEKKGRRNIGVNKFSVACHNQCSCSTFQHKRICIILERT